MSWFFILQALYFFLPAYCANMAPVIFRRFPWLGFPVSEKYFGSHKTWRGLVVAVLFGTAVFWIQRRLYTQGFVSWALVDYSGFSLWFGVCMSAGAILGDLVKSYYKRKVDIAPGKPWLGWDQLDFVIGGLIGVMFVYVPDVLVVVVLLVLSSGLHVLVNYLGYILKIQEKKF